MSSWELTKHLPVFGIFNDIHCTYLHGVRGITLVQPVKLVIGKMRYRGMEFGGAHVWKTSHPQAMEFFLTQNLGTCTLE